MNYTTVYESVNVNIFHLILVQIISIIIVTLVIIGGLIWYRYEKKKENPSKVKLYNLLGGMLLGVIYIMYAFISIIEYPIYQNNIYNRYIDNNVSVIEGVAVVEMDEEDSEQMISISLNEINFNIKEKYVYNYSNTKTLCLYDGEYARITYVTYKDNNFIMRIDKVIAHP